MLFAQQLLGWDLVFSLCFCLPLMLPESDHGDSDEPQEGSLDFLFFYNVWKYSYFLFLFFQFWSGMGDWQSAVHIWPKSNYRSATNKAPSLY